MVLMMVKKGSRSEDSGKAGRKVPVKTDTAAMEEQTIERAGRTIRALEEFLGRWDSADSRPDGMFPQVMRIRQFCMMLKSWYNDALAGKGNGDEESRMRRLRDFVLLCSTYS